MTRAKRVLRGVDRLMTWLGCALLVNNIRMRLVYRFNKRGAERLPFDKRGAERLPFDKRGAERYRLTSAVQSGYRLTNQGLLVKQKVLNKCGVGWFDACA